MGTKSHNARKPKLIGRHLGSFNERMPTMAGADSPLTQDGKNAAPEKHKMSFAQHQHELQLQQKSTSHK